ncbi:protein MON2 homolog isoform X2 [Asterias amurensis]|uniref:protein MON2 homolog isoform X2 n=1 Tax=Asterias amurensis TaxID=7602 RepID=UPI003AB6F269
MAGRAGETVVTKRLVENLQTDLRGLSNESKRKFPPVKEAAEAGILKIRTIAARNKNILPALVACSGEILQPFLLGCDTKNLKIVQLCLGSVQRLITHEALSVGAASNVINMLWNLMEGGIEDLKVLQTAVVILTSNTIVRGPALARAIVVCFRLHFSKDNTTSNTASAIVQQVISIVMERVLAEDDANADGAESDVDLEKLKSSSTSSKAAPKSLRPCATDAYLLFQDLCYLLNGDHPYWLSGMTEMTRTFGLELLESVLNSFPQIFLRHKEFSFLLKERVCPLVIKLFSPSIKHRQGIVAPSPPTSPEKPSFPISMRLLRVVSVLINKYYTLLVTECEIFLSLLVKFMESDKCMWQRILALEVMYKLCSQAKLLRCFCQSYDMKPHSTKIFANIVNALGSFIQSLFVNPVVERQSSLISDKQGKEMGSTSSMQAVNNLGGSSVTPHTAFSYKGVWIPLLPVSYSKPVFLEMLDKADAPLIPEGYAISVAFASLLDVVKGVTTIVTQEMQGEERRLRNQARDRELHVVNSETKEKESTEEKEEDTNSFLLQVDEGLRLLWEEIVNSSWCGVLAALTLLLDACMEESATESILKSQELYASLCGKLGLTVPRDAFVTSLCKASLPPHYALTVLNIAAPQTPSNQPRGHMRSHSRDNFLQGSQGAEGGSNETDGRNQVVAVGTPLATVVGTQQGPVMLTAKNIQCMRAILSLAHCHGSILGTAWHLVLTTLQHLVWILGLKPAAGGSLKVGSAAEAPNTVITTAVMAELPVLSAMLSRLFESSQYLDDVALHHLIDALCKLSTEAMDMAFSNREPSLFAVAKLLETGLVNMSRMEVLWRPVTAHLLEVCSHPHVRMRGWGAEAVTALVKASLGFKHEPPVHQNLRLQTLLLGPLQELSSIPHADIRQKQLECVHQLLSSNGETMVHGWPLVLGVIGAVTEDQGESLIRTAFQSLQLVVTDFLPIMPCYCLQISVTTAAKFGLQQEELNISLTAVGLLWNISDYLYQNRDKIREGLEKESQDIEAQPEGCEQPVPPFDALWLTLYSRLADLCVDPRPAVRKSGGQTLFSTISAHGALLKLSTWQIVLWQVLFPLLDKVKKLSGTAGQDKVEGVVSGNILIHHSRDTAEKQWAETKVLTLAGVARVFNTWRHALLALGDFPRAWALLLEHIEASSLSQSSEVSLAALKSFQEILQIQPAKMPKSLKSSNQVATGLANDLPIPGDEQIKRNNHKDSVQDHKKQVNGATATPSSTSNKDTFDDTAMWAIAWRVWHSIGITSTTPPSSRTANSLPTQPFLTALVQIFPPLFDHIKPRFIAADLQKLCTVLQCAVSVPVQADVSVFIIPSLSDSDLTPLQEAVLHCLYVVQQAIGGASESMQSMYPAVFDQLLTFVTYSCQAPSFGQIETKVVTKASSKQSDWVSMNYVPFAEKALEMTTALYKTTASHPQVVRLHVLQNILKVLQLPLGLKYACPSPTTWKLAISSLLEILPVGLPVARQPSTASHFTDMWLDLAAAFELFLFSDHPAPTSTSVEEQQRVEAIDVQVVQMVRQTILPHSTNTPELFTARIMTLLNRGSIHSANTASFLDVDNRQLREEFAKSCFETLLQFSFIAHDLSKMTDEGGLTKMALSALLQRCQEVLQKYVEDERLSGKCPLPRSRMAEMSFVLQAITTLIHSLKKANSGNVDHATWSQVIDLYPYLVDCTTCTSSQVCNALKEALSQYQDLLVAPVTRLLNGT